MSRWSVVSRHKEPATIGSMERVAARCWNREKSGFLYGRKWFWSGLSGT